jgi:hypothetical protein
MKPYRFRLETVLRVRRSQAIRAGYELAQAARQHRDAMWAEEAATSSYERFVNGALPDGTDSLGDTAGSPASGGTVDSARPFGDFLPRFEQGQRLGAVLQETRSVRHRRWTDEEHARQRLLDAQRSVTLLENLDQRRRDEWKQAVARQETAELDEFAGVRAARGAL